VDFEIATNPKYEPNWHHERIAKELEHILEVGDRDYKILILSVPPRHGKSQQATIDFPAWVLGRAPHKEIITASYSSDLALDFGTKTRELVDSDVYKSIFATRLKEDEQSKARWKTATPNAAGKMKSAGGGYTSVGVGGGLTGRGADFLIIDDPIKNREEADSLVYREKVWTWFTSTAWTRLHPGGVVIIILTRWHVDDIVGRILSNEEFANEKVKILRFKAIATKESKNRKFGDALWPERYSKESLMTTKSLVGPYDWQSLYQGSPILSEDQEFKTEWHEVIDEKHMRLMNTRRFLTVDTAMSKKTKADFCGFCDNRVNRENFWHFKAWRMKLSPAELVDTLFTLHLSNKYEKIGIEKTAYLEGLKLYIEEEERKRNTFLPIVELSHNQVNKEVRIRGLIPRYASHSVFHIENECDDLEEEQMQFPNAVHDDVLDAAAYQIPLIEEAGSAATVQVKGPRWKGYNKR